MQKLIVVQKQDLISKYGHYFVIQNDSSPGNYIIKEQLGNKEDLFWGDDRCYHTLIEAKAHFIKLIKEESIEVIKEYENQIKRLSFKWMMFKYNFNLWEKQHADNIYKYLVKVERAKKNIDTNTEFKITVETIPDEVYVPEFMFEANQNYYFFEHASNYHSDSLFFPIKVKYLEFENNRLDSDGKQIIGMSARFVNMYDKEFSGNSIDSRDLLNFNGEYFVSGYSNQYLFINKEDCYKFAKEKIQENINKLEATINSLV